MIYLDNNATTKVDEKVVEAMLPYFSQNYANPSSMYDIGGKNSKIIQESRDKIRDFFGANNLKEILVKSKNSAEKLSQNFSKRKRVFRHSNSANEAQKTTPQRLFFLFILRFALKKDSHDQSHEHTHAHALCGRANHRTSQQKAYNRR